MKINRNKLAWILAAALALGGTGIAGAQQIRNSSGSYQGRVENDGRVYNSSGSYLGRIESDGRIYNSSGSYQGRVESNGRIYNSSGSYIGEARGIEAKKAAALFFFHFI